MNQERTFGIEIEAYNVERRDVVDALNRAGIRAVMGEYTTRAEQHGCWVVKTDTSISGWNSFELVSPPLSGQAGLDEIRKACEVLNGLGAKVNRSCGLHVHHDAREFTVKHFRNLVKLYYRLEPLLDRAMPMSRRDSYNRYCKSMRRLPSYMLERLSQAKNVSQIRNLFHDRYMKLNLASWWERGTVEFRHHSGTTDPEKIVNWVVFTQLIVNRADGIIRTMNLAQPEGESLEVSVVKALGCHAYYKECDDQVKAAVRWVVGRIEYFTQREAA